MSRRSLYILIAVAVVIALIVIALIFSSQATASESITWRLCWFQQPGGCRGVGGGGGGSW